jgi:hypothetical protein
MSKLLEESPVTIRTKMNARGARGLTQFGELLDLATVIVVDRTSHQQQKLS